MARVPLPSAAWQQGLQSGGRSAQALFARGVHLATNTYEIGTPGLDVETVNAAEVSLRRTRGDTTMTASLYRYGYDGYIFADTLDAFEAFRLIRYDQADAVFTGFEGEIKHRFTPWFTGEVFGDLVRAKFDNGGGAVPRIPAARLGARGEFLWDAWSGELEYTHAFEQDRISAFETITPGYDMVNATVAYDFTVGGVGAQIYLRGNNLLDGRSLQWEKNYDGDNGAEIIENQQEGDVDNFEVEHEETSPQVMLTLRAVL